LKSQGRERAKFHGFSRGYPRRGGRGEKISGCFQQGKWHNAMQKTLIGKRAKLYSHRHQPSVGGSILGGVGHCAMLYRIQIREEKSKKETILRLTCSLKSILISQLGESLNFSSKPGSWRGPRRQQQAHLISGDSTGE